MSGGRTVGWSSGPLVTILGKPLMWGGWPSEWVGCARNSARSVPRPTLGTDLGPKTFQNFSRYVPQLFLVAALERFGRKVGWPNLFQCLSKTVPNAVLSPKTSPDRSENVPKTFLERS